MFSWLEDWLFGIQEEGYQSISNDQAIDLEHQRIPKIITLSELYHVPSDSYGTMWTLKFWQIFSLISKFETFKGFEISWLVQNLKSYFIYI